MSTVPLDPRTFHALLYDFDGTLVDSFGPIRQSFNTMLHHLGIDRELSDSETMALVGGPLEESVSRLVPPSQVSDGTLIFRAHYEKIFLDLTYPMAGAGFFLENAAKAGLRQGVVTNKLGSSARAIVRHLGWDPLLPLCLGEGDGLRLKPDPAMILAASEGLGVPLDRILFVGDSPFDFQASRKAGCRICLVSTGTHTAEELSALGPDLLMKSLDNLWQWFRGPDTAPCIRVS